VDRGGENVSINFPSWRAGLAWCFAFGCGVLAGLALSGARPFRGEAAARDAKPKEAGWLLGTPQERFAKVEKHLRGLDGSMAEVGHRYGELLVAASERNWEYAQYQAEKIDLSLRLAVERRPKREKSARPFLDKDLPRVFAALKAKDAGGLEQALAGLHEGCVRCHAAEMVLYFKGAVERIRDQARGPKAPPRDR
jgi:hypothetical protein